MFTSPGSSPTIDAHDIDDAIALFAARVVASPDADLLAGWAVATLAAKLGLTVAMSPSADPVEIIRDLGDAWAAEFGRGLDDVPPAGVPDVLRAARAVIQGIVEEVQRRGLDQADRAQPRELGRSSPRTGGPRRCPPPRSTSNVNGSPAASASMAENFTSPTTASRTSGTG